MDAAGATFTTPLRVRFGETDAMGVANNAAYLQYFEIGRIEYLRSMGHSYAEVHDGGMDMVVAEASIHYRRPLRFDDEFVVGCFATANRWPTASPATPASTARRCVRCGYRSG
jgi:acyl-CoA thioester hydrolase